MKTGTLKTFVLLYHAPCQQMKRFVYYFLCIAILCSCQKSEINRKLIPIQSGAKFGYVDPKGNYLINPQFDRASAFRDGLALVQSDGLYGYIQESGEYVINPVFPAATVFMEGIAWVVKKNGPPTAIDRKGNELFSLKEADVVYNYSEGLALFKCTPPEAEDEILYGFVDKVGNTVIPPMYTYATEFHEGLASVIIPGEGYGFINTKGEMVINPQFNNAHVFKNGLAVVSNSENKYGVINKEGKYVINPQFRRMRADEDGFIIVFQDGTDFGKCDKSGKTVINPQFEELGKMGKNGLSLIVIKEKCGFINKEGLIVINPQYQGAFTFVDDYAFVCMDGKWGTIDKDGKYIINPQFNAIGNDFVNVDNLLSYNLLYQVESDFFDIEKIVSALKGIITKDEINGNINFSTPISRIMKDYDLKEQSISKSESLQSIKTISLSNDASMKLLICGKFYDKISDGWWGYNQVLNPNACPQELQLIIDLKNNGEGKGPGLMSEIQTGFGLSPNTTEWSCGKFDLKLTAFVDKVLITITPNSGNLTVSSSDNVTISYSGRSPLPTNSIFSEELLIVKKDQFVGSAPKSVKAGDSFRLAYTIDKATASTPSGINHPDFETIMGPTTSTSISTTTSPSGNKEESTRTYTYILQSKKEGTFTFPPITVQSDGKSYTSNSVTIKVTSN